MRTNYVTVGTLVFQIISTFDLIPITEIENQTGYTYHEFAQEFKNRMTKIQVSKEWHTYIQGGWRKVILDFQFGESTRLLLLLSFIITFNV